MKGDGVETSHALGFLKHEGMELIGLQECQNVPSYLVHELGYEAKWSTQHVLGDDARDRRCIEGNAGVLIANGLQDSILETRERRRFVVVALRGPRIGALIVASLYLPHVEFYGRSAAQMDRMFTFYQDILLELVETIIELRKKFGIKEVVIMMDANVEVHQDVIIDRVQVTGKGVQASTGKSSQGGFEKMREKYRDYMSRSLCMAMARLQ